MLSYPTGVCPRRIYSICHPTELEELAESLGASRYRGRQLADVDLSQGRDRPGRDDRPAEGLPAPRWPSATRSRCRRSSGVTPSQDGSRKLVLPPGRRRARQRGADARRRTGSRSACPPRSAAASRCAFCLHRHDGARAQPHGGGDRRPAAGAPTGSLEGEERVTHIVFMGMGEPLANYAASCRRCASSPTRSWGSATRPRRITVSTVGLVDRHRPARRARTSGSTSPSRCTPPPTRSAGGSCRSTALGTSRRCMAACAAIRWPSRQRMFFEYVLLEDVNDTPRGRAPPGASCCAASAPRST